MFHAVGERLEATVAPPVTSGVPAPPLCLGMNGVVNGDFMLMDWPGVWVMTNGWLVGAAGTGA